MSLRAGCQVMLFVVGLSLLVPFTARAEEVQALGLTLHRTYLKTENGLLDLSEDAVAAFSPTTVSCPGPSPLFPCTIRLEVSSAFETRVNSLPLGSAFADMFVLIDSSAVGVSPKGDVVALYRFISADPFIEAGFVDLVTFSWIKTGVGDGAHTVEVLFTGVGFATARYRTLTIEVYTGQLRPAPVP